MLYILILMFINMFKQGKMLKKRWWPPRKKILDYMVVTSNKSVVNADLNLLPENK